MNRFDLLHTPLEGRNLIEASAGTGKTFTIAGVYLRLVLEQRLEVGKILVVTFTEAATKELKERIRKRLKEAEHTFEVGTSSDPLLSALLQQFPVHNDARRVLSSAVRSFDEAAIFTIHGFCQRTLQENPFESGSLCDTELLTDQGTILREIAQDYWRINFYTATRERIAAATAAGLTPGSLLALARRAGDPFTLVIPDAHTSKGGQAPSNEASTAASQQASDEDWLLALKRGFFDYLRAELPKRKSVRNVRSFDDLLIDLYTAVSRKGSPLPGLIRDRYQAALIDEFQDTDPVQFAIFDAIYPKGNTTPFFLIGDPKQAIYSFRGADIFAYIAAAKATPQQHTLLQNWRSEPGLISAVNTVFSSRDLPFLFEEIGFTGVEAAQTKAKLVEADIPNPPPLKVWFAPRKEAGKPINKGDAWDILPETVASEISRLLRDGAKGKVKIVQREKGSDGEERDVEQNVEPRHIAVLVRANRQAKLMQRALTHRGIPSVLCSAGNLFESDEAAELLRLLSAVAEPGHEALLRGALATDLAGVKGEELARLIEDESGWERVLEEFRCYHESWGANGCMSMVLQFMERRQVRERLLSEPMGERRLTNLLHAVETIHQAQVEEHLGMEGVIAWLACRITEEPKREEHEIRLETDEAAVQLVTIHKSKGLEYPIVFLPFCWSEFSGKDETALFHNESGRVVLDIGSEELDANKSLAEREGLAESLRLLYVALTRGKHRSYVIWGAFKDAGDSALHYLLHPDATPVKGQVALSDEAMLEELARLAASSDNSIEVVPMPAADMVPYQQQDKNAKPLEFTRFSGSIPRDWRVASFTSLASRHHAAAELPDRDEGAPAEGTATTDGPSPPPGGGRLGGGEASTDSTALDIFAFPRGAKAGIFLHEIFERLDFTSAASMEPLVVDLLGKHNFGAEWSAPVCAMVAAVLNAPLGAERFTLAEVGMDRRLTELEFFFPLAPVSSDRLREAVSRYFGHSTGGAGPIDMAALFDRLSFLQIQGMLRGFIDLVVEHNGRYFILDWKSNHLGNCVEEYDEAGMRHEMEKSLYPLQYLLYTVALDSYLRLRIPDYDYDRHFGGIFYIFLRGVDGTGNGIFADRPPKEFIAELSAVLLPPRKEVAAAKVIGASHGTTGGHKGASACKKSGGGEQLSLEW
jgi:exodeoxyribonuclease V beta subunit